MTADVVKLPPADPIFALAPELKLHQSEIDGALVVNSREFARGRQLLPSNEGAS